MRKLPIDHDTRWKILITVLFKDFVAYFLPDIYPLVDWNRPVVPLDKELHKLVADKFKGGYVVSDKLFKVFLKSGEEELLLIHIEVESSNKPNIDERMFVYFYRIYDTFGKVVTAIAIFASDSLPKNYDRFEYEKHGTKAIYEYNTFALKNVSEKELLTSDNPFALALLAVKYLDLSKDEDELRYDFKRTLFQLAIERQYGYEKIDALLQFIELLLALPNKLENKFIKEMEATYLKPEVSEYEKRIAQMWLDGMYKTIHGETVDEFRARIIRESREETEKTVEKAKEKAEKKAEKKIEKAEKKAEKAEKEAAKSAKQSAEQSENAIKNMLTNTNLSVQQIAEIQGVTEQKVLDIQAKINGK